MAISTQQRPIPWKAIRELTGFSQREVERRLGWKTGHLSWIERGIQPGPEKAAELRAFYAAILLANTPEQQAGA